jgi:DNA-binding PadR family transcriptional regulator
MTIDATTVLLQLLLSRESYGLDLIADAKKKNFPLSQGAAYTALHEMQASSLVSVKDGPRSKQGGRPRRYYRLTTKGRILAEKNRTKALDLFSVRVRMDSR